MTTFNLGILFRPVSLIIAIVITLISFGSLPITEPQTVCSRGFIKSVGRNFYHANLAHLGVNLVTFSVLSRVEDYIGSGPYLLLLIMILLISSTLDLMITLVFPDMYCSIGFSGILFGLLAWEKVALNDFSPFALMLLMYNVISPTLRDPKASLVGHSMGALAGIIVALFKKATNVRNKS